MDKRHEEAKRAIAPMPVSEDEICEQLECMTQRRAVNPEYESARIMTR